MSSIIYLCFVLAATVSRVASVEPDPVSETTNYTYDLSALRNGIYDNSAQSRQNSSLSFTQLKALPMSLSFTERPALYIEIAINSTVIRAFLQILLQARNGTVVYLDTFTITAAIGRRFNTFNANTLSNSTQADLGQNQSCLGAAVRLAKAVYMINQTDCSSQPQAGCNNIVETDTCRSIGLVLPLTIPTVRNIEPVTLNRRGDRFPTRNPDNFASLC